MKPLFDQIVILMYHSKHILRFADLVMFLHPLQRFLSLFRQHHLHCWFHYQGPAKKQGMSYASFFLGQKAHGCNQGDLHCGSRFRRGSTG